MKLKDKCNSIPFDTPIDVSKIKGHVTIELFDKETGEVVERREGHNFLTNAIQQYFKNCGFMNFPNVNQSNMVEELMGGVMGFDTALGDSVNTVHIPAGVLMTFNGAVGTVNSGQTPSEMGSYITDDSGWQENGSYLQVYEFQTGQGNGTIAAVCISGKDYSYIGEGNATSAVKHATTKNISSLAGTVTTYSGVSGTPFHFDLTDSSCYTFEVVTENDTKVGKLRKYRLPISKLNLKGTATAPIMLSETNVTLDADFITYTQASGNVQYYIHMEPFDGKLMMYNAHQWRTGAADTLAWGTNWTQYLWTLDTSGTLTKTQLTNTSGDSTLPGLQLAHFDGNYIFFVKAKNLTSNSSLSIDTSNVYILNRTTGAISTVANAFGRNNTFSGGTIMANIGTWGLIRATGDGRIIVSEGYLIDAVKGAVYVNNATKANSHMNKVSGLIRSQNAGINLYRDQTYIATIFNLDTPVIKTADKSMRVSYRLTFDEEDS